MATVLSGCGSSAPEVANQGIATPKAQTNNPAYIPEDTSSSGVIPGLDSKEADALEMEDVVEGDAEDALSPEDGVSAVDVLDGGEVTEEADGEDVPESDVPDPEDVWEDADVKEEDIEEEDTEEEDTEEEDAAGEEGGEGTLPDEKGACCEAHATPGCDEADCEALVCEGDPYCCALAWDALCIQGALNVCAQCSDEPLDSCCATQDEPGCENLVCETQICAADPYCCETKWDGLCVQAAESDCTVCGGVTPEASEEDCCLAHETPGCGDASCEALVCEIDPFCCNTQWDNYCVACGAGEDSFGGSSCGNAKSLCGCTTPYPTLEALAEHWAPVWYHDVDDSNTEGDYFTAIDADGDLVSSNNWESLSDGLTDLRGVIYWSVITTETHWFILYANFHPQDWDEVCSAGALYKVCHENDMEGAMVVVQKDGYGYGQFRVMYTQAHNHLYMYRNDVNITKKSGELREVPVTFENGSHPQVYVEAGGHGVCALYHNENLSFSADFCSHDIGDQMEDCIDAGGNDCDPGDYFPGGDGIVYRHKAVGEIPSGAFDKDVGYALVPFESEIWDRRENLCNGNCLFDKTFEYEGVTLPKAFDGETWEDDKANPPWAWDSADDGEVYRGDWFFKPAHSLLIHVSMPEEVSLTYTENPYLTFIDP